MVGRKRSKEKLRKRRSKWKRSRGQGTSELRVRGGKVDSDRNVGVEENFDWIGHTRKVLETFDDRVIGMVDGTGVPAAVKWEGPISVDERYQRVSETLADCVLEEAQRWTTEPGVTEFLQLFQQSSREKQEMLSSKWKDLGIEKVGERLARRFAKVLSLEGMADVDTLLKRASPTSPIRGRLLECLCRATSEGTGRDDLDICYAIMGLGGAPVGIEASNLLENQNIWPTYSQKPLKKGECEGIRWCGKDEATTPRPKPVVDEEMRRLTREQLQVELDTGRMQGFSKEVLSEDDSRHVLALTRLGPIWKNSQHDRVRLISNYRESGVNSRIKEQMKTTIALPSLTHVRRMLMDDEIPPQPYIGEYDIKGAYRSISVADREKGFLALVPPEGCIELERPILDVGRLAQVILWENNLPFGLVSSGSIFQRTNACIHRVQNRLLGLIANRSHPGLKARNRRPKGIIYIDDSTWVLGCILELICLLLIVLSCGLEPEYKKTHFSKRDARVIGWRIDLPDGREGPARISIPHDKRLRYAAEIREILEADKVDLTRLAKIQGKLTWCSQVMKAWRTSLASLYAMTSLQNKGIRVVRWNNRLKRDLKFFVDALDLSSGPCQVSLPCLSTERWAVVCDACLYGIGGCVVSFEDPSRGYWYNINDRDDPTTWCWILAQLGNDAPSELSTGDMSALELIAVALGVMVLELGEGPRAKTGEVSAHAFSDNAGAVGVIKGWRTRSPIMRGILGWLHDWSTRLSAQHLPGIENEGADYLSRHSKFECREYIPQSWEYIALDEIPSKLADNAVIK